MTQVSNEVTHPGLAKLTPDELKELHRISHEYEVNEYGNIRGYDRRILNFIFNAVRTRPDPEPAPEPEPYEVQVYKASRNALYAGIPIWEIADRLPQPYNNPTRLRKFLKTMNPRLL